jgi:hypothetical protein
MYQLFASEALRLAGLPCSVDLGGIHVLVAHL